MATFRWEAESRPLAFIIPVSHIVLDAASQRPFVFLTFPPPPAFNPDLSFAGRRRNGIAGRELLLWKEIAEPEQGVHSSSHVVSGWWGGKMLFGFGRTILVACFSILKSILVS